MSAAAEAVAPESERAMSGLPHRSPVLLLAGVLAIPVGCMPPYVEATSAFAKATSAGMDAFVPAFDTASQLCRSRARYHYGFARVQNLSELRWSDWYTKHELEEGGTWAKHCAKLTEGDAMLLQGLQAVGSYADALEAVADAGDYDGADLETLVNSSAALGDQISTESTKHTDTVKGLAGPIGKIAGWIVQAHARRKLQEAIKEGAPHVDAILDALTAYNDATGIELVDARERLDAMLDAADRRLVVDALPNPNAPAGMPLQPDGMTVLGFVETARTYERELDDIAAQQAAYGRVLRGLRSAQASLVAVAEDKKTEAEAMKEVLGIAADVITQIDTIKSVAGGKD